MPDLNDGETAEINGSARLPYVLRNVGGVYSCSCPAWRNQSIAIGRRTCKHLRKYRGDAAEQERIGSPPPARAATGSDANDDSEKAAGPALLLAHTWENDVDLAGWWLSEKLDGVRAYWDGKQFLSRQGNVFHAPDWFVEKLPKEPLDGELWLARKSFQRTVSIVRRQDKSDHWREIRYLVFDMPALATGFEERVKQLRECLTDHGCDFATPHDQTRCEGVEHLQAELARVEALGGEGLMLRQPGSRYEAGRSTTLLKVKTFHDAEAQVLEHLPGAGRHKGRLGALAVALPDGTLFSVGTGFSDAQRENPPPVGSTITFRYQELSDRGVPRFPSFVRLHADAKQVPPAPSVKPSSVPKQNREATAVAAATPANFRRFELIEGNAAKFWEVVIDGNDVTVRYGRIGTDGQTQTKFFADAAAAEKHAEKLIAEKTKKGYGETPAE
ncbi:MAG: DNA ligase [Planctomycetia bacterium]|nr:DNA ligase [Planctomycetia bacterium]